jgi:hypothetical protein
MVNLLIIFLSFIANHFVPFHYTLSVYAMFFPYIWNMTYANITLTDFDLPRRIERTPYFAAELIV